MTLLRQQEIVKDLTLSEENKMKRNYEKPEIIEETQLDRQIAFANGVEQIVELGGDAGDCDSVS